MFCAECCIVHTRGVLPKSESGSIYLLKSHLKEADSVLKGKIAKKFTHKKINTIFAPSKTIWRGSSDG